MKAKSVILIISALCIYAVCASLALTGCAKQKTPAVTEESNVQDDAGRDSSARNDMHIGSSEEEAEYQKQLQEAFSDEHQHAVIELDPDAEIYYIGDKDYIARCEYVYDHFDDIQDKTIVIEGLFYSQYFPEDGRELSFVYRNVSGAVNGQDAMVGFEIVYSGRVQPSVDEWVKITATPIKLKRDDGSVTPVLYVHELELPETRGEEFVAE